MEGPSVSSVNRGVCSSSAMGYPPDRLHIRVSSTLRRFPNLYALDSLKGKGIKLGLISNGYGEFQYNNIKGLGSLILILLRFRSGRAYASPIQGFCQYIKPS